MLLQYLDCNLITFKVWPLKTGVNLDNLAKFASNTNLSLFGEECLNWCQFEIVQFLGY